MSISSAGTQLCEPTELYNFLTQCSKLPAVLDDTYLILFDAREISEYYKAHIALAKIAKREDEPTRNGDGDGGRYRVPFGAHLPTTHNCVIYDSNTVSTIENTPAVQLANMLAARGSKNPVKILKGGYERFSAEYPFLRTEKIMYTPLELQSLPLYPSEILPLFLYLGNRQHAYNAAMNYDLKIRAHVSVGNDLQPAFPNQIVELNISAEDDLKQDLVERFEEVYEFIETHRRKRERVLVFSELGISRAATLVLAYLIKKNKWSLKDSYKHIQHCRHHIQPLQAFLQQLLTWEKETLGETLTDITQL